MAKATWLSRVLRDAGCTVIEMPDWEDAGRGEMSSIKGVMLHHTGSNPKGGDHPALEMVRHGRADPPLPGPLSHLLLSRDGTFYVIAAGRCNHAGKGKWQGITDGNRSFIGIEAENNGLGEEWPQVQMDAYVNGVAAILRYLKADDVMAVGHREWALPAGRKIDPLFDMFEFREEVARINGNPDNELDPFVMRPIAPARAMLKKGSMGNSVRQLQKLLSVASDGNFGPKTEAAVRAFQKVHHLVVDGKVGPKTWSALGIK
jgi:N-acetyl-anhydromuramyl-L-alanine amidase AmpD